MCIYLIIVHTTKIMNHTHYLSIYISNFHFPSQRVKYRHIEPSFSPLDLSVSLWQYSYENVYTIIEVWMQPRTIFQTNLFGFCICFLATLRICKYHKQFFAYPFDFSCLLITTDLFPIRKLFACRDSLFVFLKLFGSIAWSWST